MVAVDERLKKDHLLGKDLNEIVVVRPAVDLERVALGGLLQELVEPFKRVQLRIETLDHHAASLGEADAVSRLLMHLCEQRIVIEERNLDCAARLKVGRPAHEAGVAVAPAEPYVPIRFDDETDRPVPARGLV